MLQPGSNWKKWRYNLLVIPGNIINICVIKTLQIQSFRSECIQVHHSPWMHSKHTFPWKLYLFEIKGSVGSMFCDLMDLIPQNKIHWCWIPFPWVYPNNINKSAGCNTNSVQFNDEIHGSQCLSPAWMFAQLCQHKCITGYMCPWFSLCIHSPFSHWLICKNSCCNGVNLTV